MQRIKYRNLPAPSSNDDEIDYAATIYDALHSNSKMINRENICNQNAISLRRFTGDVNKESQECVEISDTERLKNLKNLRMTRNFTQFAGGENLSWTHIDRKNDDYTDNLSEKDFQIISYEEMLPIQLVENEKIVKNSSTFTHDLKTLALDAVYHPAVIEQGASCKEEQMNSSYEPTLDDWQVHENDHVSSGDDDEFLDIEISEVDDDEQIESNILNYGQNESMMDKLLCQEEYSASPQEHEYIDDGLDFVEERLRNIMIDLSDELKKVKDMEHRLSDRSSPSFSVITSAMIP
ncbi:hypothetical protein QAD02_004030 [Eretmocerus hayati]|uniref:Uncharacterized protein n=1 Tax=Eretmocerus hayati TaxID=131215 RepID=A0ACC2NNK0_9HYME|nr:hypothetical protein QAD02_004030 [Eretmocerus hayati]